MDLSRFNKYENTKKHLKEIDPYGEDNWEEIDIKEKFIKFLKENGAYDSYGINLFRHRGASIDKYINQDFMIPKLYILSAFEWINTGKESSFWRELNKKWEKEISKYI